MNPSEIKVLEVVMKLPFPTVNGISAACGWRSKGMTHKLLKMLRAKGLVDWEEGKNGTIHPTCRFIPVRELS
jgi:SOS-response transcriptional repressor LexA